MNVVISQSMLFPWVGILEQIRLAGVYVYYDDVQFSKGSFTNRVQVKLPSGMRWMSIPLQGAHLGQAIEATRVVPAEAWRGKHMQLLRQSFEATPFAADALAMADEIFSGTYDSIGMLARASLMALVRYFALDESCKFIDVRDLQIGGSGSSRVLEIVRSLKGNCYITGHGAVDYLEHEVFEKAGIKVEYMDYQLRAYPQQHGAFTPYVTGLDLVANCGKDGIAFISSSTMPWRSFLDDAT